MAKSGGFSKSKAKKLIKDIDDRLIKFKKSYSNLEKAITAIETGKNSDGEIGLWSGKKARTWVIAAKTQWARDAKLYNDLAGCVDTLESAVASVKDQ